MKKLKLVLIGAGGIGKQWASGIKRSDTVELAAVVDADIERAKALATEYGSCPSFTDWTWVAEVPGVDGAIVAVPHNMLAPITKGVLEKGKHVLCEKPAGISAAEVAANIALAKSKKLVYMTGFNHRYHPAFAEAKKRFGAGEIGEIMFIRARHGFGGRPGYEKEWRFSKKIGGGGEFIDQGMHMIDLARWFMGEFVDVKGFAENFFWGGEVEDNGFALLRTKERRVAQIHVSWTQWDWLHSYEIFGTKGYLLVDGLDQRYHGPEKLTIGHADARSGKFPTEEVVTYGEEQKDDSLRREAEDLARAIRGDKVGIARGEDAKAVLEIVEKIYRNN
jgi:predicted dehydrogenase